MINDLPSNVGFPSGMNEFEHQQVIAELQGVIDDTQHTLVRFEATGMDEQMPEDYDKLLEILDDAVKHQRGHALVMCPLPDMSQQRLPC